MLTVTENWKAAYPGASVGILAVEKVDNPENHPGLSRAKNALEQALRDQFAEYDRQKLRALPVLRAYDTYYRQFKKTYHVQLQLESILFKEKSIPTVSALVEAMFMAELKDQMLTAGHDLDQVRNPVVLDVAQGIEEYIRINKQSQTLKKGDMYIADQEGVLSCIIYGPDYRSRITPNTQRALFTTYAPHGISSDQVYSHLEAIQEYALLVSPHAQVAHREVYTA